MITPFCKVHFISATKRNPELLVGFCDYGMANIEGQGISVESIPPPLKFARVSIRETSTH